MRKAAVLALWIAGLAAAAQGESHVRVVLDVSGSMKSNDPDKTVFLATLLLHDLAKPNTTLGDTFKVLPFEEKARTVSGSWEWKKPADPVPTAHRDWIVARTNHRGEFVKGLTNLPYDSIRTFFYPGILRSLDDLEASSTAKDDIRVIVLVTDGVPEPATRDREAELIRQDLVPRLEAGNVRLYVLAFGKEAYGNLSFFDQMITGGGNVKLGAHFVDPQGDKLLDNMLKIFGRSFGYTPDTARQLPGVPQLNLEGDVTPDQVAVVVLSPRKVPPQKLALTPPPNGLVQNPDGMQQATVPAGSYALRWMLVPDKGQYGFDTDVTQGSVAVVRPTRLEMEIRSVAPHSVDRTMAQTKLPLEVLVRPPSGAQGDPGLVQLSFLPHGPRNTEPDGDPYLWQGEKVAALSSTGQLTPEGRLYEIDLEFPENRDAPDEVYGGFLEMEARRGEALVASLVAEFAHRVEVHPRLSIVSLPGSDLASATALESLERSCTEFSFELNHGALPHPDQPEYGVRAVLEPADATVVTQELRDATFTLDDREIVYEGQPGDNPGEWYKGRTLGPEELLGAHEICVTLGEPTKGDPSNPIELPVVFTLQDAPYDEFGALEPFELRILIAPPSFLEKWRGWILAALAFLGVLAALWYLRDRPGFPDDLRYAVGREGGAAGLAAVPLPEGSVVPRLLGLRVERPIRVPGENRSLGRVRPIDEELYQLRLPRGTQIEAAEDGATISRDGKLATLAVHRTYRLQSGGGTYLLRMEYQ